MVGALLMPSTTDMASSVRAAKTPGGARTTAHATRDLAAMPGFLGRKRKRKVPMEPKIPIDQKPLSLIVAPAPVRPKQPVFCCFLFFVFFVGLVLLFLFFWFCFFVCFLGFFF